MKVKLRLLAVRPRRLWLRRSLISTKMMCRSKNQVHELQYVSKRWVAVLRTRNQVDRSKPNELRFSFNGSIDPAASGC
jgi:hypothetical protein